MIQIFAFAAFWMGGLSPQPRQSASVSPMKTSFCEVVQNPEKFNRKLIRFHVEYITDHIERSILIDNNCANSGGVLPYLANNEILGGKAFSDASNIRNPETLEESLTMTVTGTFHYSKKPEMCMFQNQEQCKRSIEITTIQDLSLTMKPKR